LVGVVKTQTIISRKYAITVYIIEDRITGVSFTVTVSVGLVSVGYSGAVVTEVADAISIRIGLIGIRYFGAVVTFITQAIMIIVILGGIIDGGTVIADISEAVSIRIRLVGSVGNIHTGILCIQNAIPV
jgi:hypothetical protein